MKTPNSHDRLFTSLQESDYESNIENWATSLSELEDDSVEESAYDESIRENSAALIPLSMSTYYRSKAFSNQISINSLINAADPILTLSTKLRKITIPPDPALLHQNLCHEIKAFENKAQTMGYRSQIVIAARYILCALLDELIAINLWPGIEWKKYNLIETFHKELWESDRFFLILERSLQDAAAHVDLLELIYLCLRFGYEGKYRGIERGHFELRNITDHLYHAIKQYRDEFSRSLLISIENPNLHLAKKNYFHLLPPPWAISTMMILLLVFTFTFYYLKLTETAAPIAQFLNTLKPNYEINTSFNNNNIKGNL